MYFSVRNKRVLHTCRSPKVIDMFPLVIDILFLHTASIPREPQYPTPTSLIIMMLQYVKDTLKILAIIFWSNFQHRLLYHVMKKPMFRTRKFSSIVFFVYIPSRIWIRINYNNRHFIECKQTARTTWTRWKYQQNSLK